MSETMFFSQGNVSVSSSRFIVDNQTYAMNGVTSVKASRKDPSRAGPFLIIGIGVLTLIGASVGSFLLGGILIASGIYWFKSQKPTLTVILSSSSGEAQALTSQDEKYINDVVEALNNSIVHRG